MRKICDHFASVSPQPCQLASAADLPSASYSREPRFAVRVQTLKAVGSHPAT